MPRTCTICSHGQRDEIDKALLESAPLRNIAERYGTSAQTLIRHRDRGHIAGQLAKAQDAKEVAQADTLLDRLVALQNETRVILEKAKNAKKGALNVALLAIRESARLIELQAKLTGELKNHEVTIYNITQVNAVYTQFLEKRFPEAYEALYKELLSQYEREHG